MENLETITSSPLFTLGNFVVVILFDVFLHFRSKKNKAARYEAVSNTIIEGLHNSLDGLEVRYKGSVQERITVTKIEFWNAGKETINKMDTVEKDPLRIEIPTFIEVLDIQVIDVSADSNSVSIKDTIISEDKATYPLYFEYLDNNEYFVIQIIHNTSSKEKFEFKGKIKGVKKFKEFKLPPVKKMSLFWQCFEPFSYFFSGTYFSFTLLNVNVEFPWYAWLVPGFFFFLSGYKIYYNFRNVAPAKL